MKKRLKKLWSRLPKLPRRWRVLRNLAAAAALGALAVHLLDWPCFTAYDAFQKIEGAYLLAPSLRPAFSPRGTAGSPLAAPRNSTARAAPST